MSREDSQDSKVLKKGQQSKFKAFEQLSNGTTIRFTSKWPRYHPSQSPGAPKKFTKQLDSDFNSKVQEFTEQDMKEKSKNNFRCQSWCGRNHTTPTCPYDPEGLLRWKKQKKDSQKTDTEKDYYYVKKKPKPNNIKKHTTKNVNKDKTPNTPVYPQNKQNNSKDKNRRNDIYDDLEWTPKAPKTKLDSTDMNISLKNIKITKPENLELKGVNKAQNSDALKTHINKKNRQRPSQPTKTLGTFKKNERKAPHYTEKIKNKSGKPRAKTKAAKDPSQLKLTSSFRGPISSNPTNH